MYEPGGLVPDHLPGGEDDLMQCPVVVIDLQRPVAVHLQTPGQPTHNPTADVHLLLDVEDGGDDVGPQVVQVTQQESTPGVLPRSSTYCYAIHVNY